MNKPSVDFDYFSFTFCPSELVAIRRMAAVSPLPLSEYLSANISEDNIQQLYKDYSLVEKVNESFKRRSGSRTYDNGVVDVDWLNDRCEQQLLDFCKSSAKKFFALKEDQDNVMEYWDELFQVRCRGMGMFGYKRSWDLYLDKTPIGVAASGAANGGCYISFSGSGCGLIDFTKLHSEIRSLPLIKITRADFAFDDYAGKNSVDYAKQCYMDGKFRLKQAGKDPSVDEFKSGGKKVPIPSSDSSEYGIWYAGGRTFQVGSRKNGKLCRIYEKGKQMGEIHSKWVRWEVELRAKDREIPLQVMLDPSSYYVTFYPVLAELIVVEQPSRIKTQKRRVSTAYKNTIKSAKRSYGALVNVMQKSRGMSDSEIVDVLTAGHSDTVSDSYRAKETTVKEAQHAFSVVADFLRYSRGFSDSEIVQSIISTKSDAVPSRLRQAFGAGIAA